MGGRGTKHEAVDAEDVPSGIDLPPKLLEKAPFEWPTLLKWRVSDVSFSENMARVVADQLARFVTLNRHQLAGHVANLDFWLDQARHVLGVLDGYEERFRRLKSAQIRYVAEHQIVTSLPFDPEITGPSDPPKRVPDAARSEARRSVTEASYRFLVRCYHDGLIPESRLRAACRDLGMSVDSADLGHRRA